MLYVYNNVYLQTMSGLRMRMSGVKMKALSSAESALLAALRNVFFLFSMY